MVTPAAQVGNPSVPGPATPDRRAGAEKPSDRVTVAFHGRRAGPAGLDHRRLHIVQATDLDRLPIERSAVAASAGIQFIRYRLIDHADLDLAVAYECDRDAEMRNAARKIRCAVDRIDHPDVAAEIAAGFLSEKRILGERSQQ